jgi:hypothetical protein
MSSWLEERAEVSWYVWAQGRPWGPYAGVRIEAFVSEGRVAATSLVSQSPDGPFLAAEDRHELSRLFSVDEARGAESGQLALPIDPEAQSSPRAVSEVPEGIAYAGAMRPLLVFAALTSTQPAALEAALGMHGPYERAGEGLWLVRARLGPAALRNALSRRLRGGDALLVVEAGLEQAAWFNLDQAEERKLRALWSG